MEDLNRKKEIRARNKEKKRARQAEYIAERKALKEKYNELIKNEIATGKTKNDRKYIRNKFASFKYTSKFLNISLEDFKEVYKDEFNVNQITLIDMEIRRERLRKGKKKAKSKSNEIEAINDNKITKGEEKKSISSFNRNLNIKIESTKVKLEGKELLQTYRKILSSGATEIKACSECGWDYKTELGWFKQAVRRAVESERLQTNKPSEDSDKVNTNVSDDYQENRKSLTSFITRKIRSPDFRKKVLITHGVKCACCQITEAQLIQAAHIIPVELDGNDNPQNGLPLCANHHLAFDSFLFAINPENYEIVISQAIKAEDIGITNKKVFVRPDTKCLEFRMDLFRANMDQLS